MTASPRAALVMLHRELVTRLDRLGVPPEARASGTYENLADVAQVLGQRECEIGDRTRLRHELAEVLAALDRMAAGTYGVCVECSERIGAARLQVLPTTSRCLACQEAAEAAGRRGGGDPWARKYRDDEDEEA